ncbi:MAG: hypothetical protein AMJ94_03405 [Deltaproteobacteria bacterium SM23_61]|nr:MAG: hypothetical protein AMJ94_03405 [Deltaproteobacteria bacterium SM23_61]
MIPLSELHVNGVSLVIEKPFATEGTEITARLRSNKKWFISKFVESQRAGFFRMSCDFMGPEEKSSCLQS